MRPGAACALALALLLAPARSMPAQDDDTLHTASRLELDIVKAVLALHYLENDPFAGLRAA